MLLYSQYNTPRLAYVVSFISKELFNDLIDITTNKQEFLLYNHPKINYSGEELSRDEFFIKNSFQTKY